MPGHASGFSDSHLSWAARLRFAGSSIFQVPNSPLRRFRTSDGRDPALQSPDSSLAVARACGDDPCWPDARAAGIKKINDKVIRDAYTWEARPFAFQKLVSALQPNTTPVRSLLVTILNLSCPVGRVVYPPVF